MGEVGVVQRVGPGPGGDRDTLFISLSELDKDLAGIGRTAEVHASAARGAIDHQGTCSRLSRGAKQDLRGQRGCHHILADRLGDAVARPAGCSSHHIDGGADQGDVGGIEPVVPVIAFDPGRPGGRCIEFDAYGGAGGHRAREQYTGKVTLLVDDDVAAVAVYGQVAGAQRRHAAHQLSPRARKTAFHTIDGGGSLQSVQSTGQAQGGAAPGACGGVGTDGLYQ